MFSIGIAGHLLLLKCFAVVLPFWLQFSLTVSMRKRPPHQADWGLLGAIEPWLNIFGRQSSGVLVVCMLCVCAVTCQLWSWCVQVQLEQKREIQSI